MAHTILPRERSARQEMWSWSLKSGQRKRDFQELRPSSITPKPGTGSHVLIIIPRQSGNLFFLRWISRFQVQLGSLRLLMTHSTTQRVAMSILRT
jgi:hypothetical protein